MTTEVTVEAATINYLVANILIGDQGVTVINDPKEFPVDTTKFAGTILWHPTATQIGQYKTTLIKEAYFKAPAKVILEYTND